MARRSTFMDKLNASMREANECWVWVGHKKPDGYGRLSINGRMKYAHRVAYEILVGPVPHGMELDHLCRNTSCVNPAHLEPVTHRENILRGVGMGGVNARKTHCKHGHEFTEDNTIILKSSGWRICAICEKVRAKRRNESPRAREQKRLYAQRPDIRERIRLYNQRPDVKARFAELARGYRAAKKQAKTGEIK